MNQSWKTKSLIALSSSIVLPIYLSKFLTSARLLPRFVESRDWDNLGPTLGVVGVELDAVVTEVPDVRVLLDVHHPTGALAPQRAVPSERLGKLMFHWLDLMMMELLGLKGPETWNDDVSMMGLALLWDFY